VKEEPSLSDNYGTASYAPPIVNVPDDQHVFRGVFFGKSSAPERTKAPLEADPGAPVISEPERHTLIVAQTRTGKGTRVIVPTLLRYGLGSVFCIDPKGENAAITATTRRALFGQKVHIVNPWGVEAATFQKLKLPPSTFNPLDILDKNDPNAVAIAQALASAICPREKSGKDAYWSEAAASFLTAVLLWLTDQEGLPHPPEPPEVKTLARARDIVTRSRSHLKEKFLAHMVVNSAFGGAIRENAASFMDLAPETYSGVMSNLAQHTKFLSDPLVKASTSASSFSMRDLVTERMNVFVVIPPDRMDTQRTWLRLLLTAGMQTYKQVFRPNTGMERCLFLIDEFPALGRLDEIVGGIGTMAGYGVDFVLVAQGMDQLKDAYGDAANTILANCAYKWFCNVSDLHSAEYVSKTLGRKTVRTSGASESHNPNVIGTGASVGSSSGETGRDLLTPDEVMNQGRDVAILLAPNSRPHYLRTVDYWALQRAFAQHQAAHEEWYWNPPVTFYPLHGPGA
jgi:type IV secretory pathway TraG/TraD family ATPase VirD4